MYILILFKVNSKSFSLRLMAEWFFLLVLFYVSSPDVPNCAPRLSSGFIFYMDIVMDRVFYLLVVQYMGSKHRRIIAFCHSLNYPTRKACIIQVHNSLILNMSYQYSMAKSPDMPSDFTAGPFVTRRKPKQDLIHTLSSLYLDTNVAAKSGDKKGAQQGEANAKEGQLPPPPSPPAEDEQSLLSMELATHLSHLNTMKE